MTIAGTDISMTRGDTESITVKLNNAIFNAGDVVTLTVRPDVESEISLQKRNIITESGSHETLIEIKPDDTKSLEFGRYIYDIQWSSDNGDTIITIIKPSKFRIEKEVTF